ncbi:MAG: phosphoribosylformylglycinamidine synthase II [Zestosphaera tikiterensis]|uniref:Phosphoribosylformylglycinamidine synthase subunit PurL n=1 Tax=Zestosphaera tikiterensis TaxID=1973259 RepID=A0A2R7YAY5_9CREN|nr:MAG: phosphoribosylformylglycinamidine synthase II [Zestosphaera tikiterensis]
MPLTSEEINEIKEILGREPTNEELAMFEAQWSEHCSYKSSKALLKLLPTKSRYVVLGPGRDAPAVEIFPGVLIVFKIESHNHPSAVDPYNGAATGVGGIVRDILTLGAKPIALLDLLYMGDPEDPHANFLIKGIVKGISDYGNRIGVPVVAGDAWFDKSFNKQPLVNVACVGIVAKDKAVLRGPAVNDEIYLVGNATGRDGLLGSSFASKPLAEDVDEDVAAVQVGDALTEKILIDALMELIDEGLVNYVKDLGGGGLATAVSEAAAEHDLGAVIHLDKVHLRHDLTPAEILTSESQERMLLAVPQHNVEAVNKILDKYDVPYSVIGHFTNDGRVKVYYKGVAVAEVPAKELAKPKPVVRPSTPPQEALKALTTPSSLPPMKDLREATLQLLTSPNISSKKWIYEQYDHEVGNRTVLKPGYGDAAVLRLLDGTARGVAVKGDGNPRYTSLDPFNGAANVVGECYRNLTAVGSTPIAVVDELNAGNPEKPNHYWYFEMMLRGIAWMSEELNVPVVGGKVSFYNEDSRGVQVRPTATVVGVGKVDDISKVKGMDFKGHGSYVAIIGYTLPELGGSEYLHRIYGLELGQIPKPKPSLEVKHAELIRKLIKDDIVSAVHDVGVGGLAVALIEMSVTSGLGFNVDISKIPSRAVGRVDELLYSETQARYLVEVEPSKIDLFKDVVNDYEVAYGVIGRVEDSREVLFKEGVKELIKIDLDLISDLYLNSLHRRLEGE